MGLFKSLSPILNYLHQIRKVEEYLLIDVYFPNGWKILKKFVIEDRIINHGQTEEKGILISFVAEINDENMDKVQNNILGIINYNLEREEKEKLLQSKIDELKNIFDKQALDELKFLKFDIKPSVELTLNNNGKSKDDGLVIESQEE